MEFGQNIQYFLFINKIHLYAIMFLSCDSCIFLLLQKKKIYRQVLNQNIQQKVPETTLQTNTNSIYSNNTLLGRSQGLFLSIYKLDNQGLNLLFGIF